MISIIVAAYNIENYIGRCLESINSQTNSNYEVIVVNDGSTDKTEQVIFEYAQKNKKIKYVNQKNKGLIEARKTGLKIASGEYIYFLDGDDWLEKDMVNSVYKKTKDNWDVLLINTHRVYETGKKVYMPLFDDSLVEPSIEDMITMKVKPAIWGKIINTKFIEKHQIEFMSNVTYGEDLAISIALFIEEPKVMMIKKPLHNYFIRKNSITRSVSENVYDIPKVLDHIENIVREKYGSKYDEQLQGLYVQKMIGEAYFSSVEDKTIRTNLINIYKRREKKYQIKNKKITRIATQLQTATYKQERKIARKIIAHKIVKNFVREIKDKILV